MPLRRLQIPAVILVIATLAALYGWAVVLLTPSHPGAIGYNLNALGTDWMVFYGGARRLIDGHLATLFDGARFTAYLNTTFAPWLTQPMPYRPWVYPPSYLFIVAPFGTLPFTTAYIAFQIATAALLAAALWFGADRPRARPLVVAAALLGPAAAINVGMGQNAFLTAALLVGGLRLVTTRPALGGALLGLLTMKPQFWLLVPVALAAARQWRALLWSVIAAAGLALASATVFGLDAWRHWIELARGSYGDRHGQWVELGRLWGDSLYACLVSAGASQGLANALQVLGTLLGAGLVYRAFRLPLPTDQKIAILLAATVFAAPHSSLADTVLLATAAGLWAGAAAAQGDASLAKWTLALALWLAEIFNPPLVTPFGALTPLLILGFIAMSLAGAPRASVISPAAPTPSPQLARTRR
ncbi:MAG TPA: glycosyltransferase family 87 protein [Stellaceae bacterium]|nr:glycosyltransferase family 87 protein [Stellaceae bacterium]